MTRQNGLKIYSKLKLHEAALNHQIFSKELYDWSEHNYWSNEKLEISKAYNF